MSGKRTWRVCMGGWDVMTGGSSHLKMVVADGRRATEAARPSALIRLMTLRPLPDLPFCSRRQIGRRDAHNLGAAGKHARDQRDHKGDDGASRADYDARRHQQKRDSDLAEAQPAWRDKREKADVPANRIDADADDQRDGWQRRRDE